jgi:hypothetical protein
MHCPTHYIELIQTCGACPEQYDAYINGEKVGYLRLRHGVFTVDYPDCGGKRLITEYPDGDGIFTYDERDEYLTRAKQAILDAYKSTLENEPNSSGNHIDPV